MLMTSGVARDRESGLYLAGSALVVRPTIVGKMEMERGRSTHAGRHAYSMYK
jgi:hypothetical protein